MDLYSYRHLLVHTVRRYHRPWHKRIHHLSTLSHGPLALIYCCTSCFQLNGIFQGVHLSLLTDFRPYDFVVLIEELFNGKLINFVVFGESPDVPVGKLNALNIFLQHSNIVSVVVFFLLIEIRIDILAIPDVELAFTVDTCFKVLTEG